MPLTQQPHSCACHRAISAWFLKLAMEWQSVERANIRLSTRQPTPDNMSNDVKSQRSVVPMWYALIVRTEPLFLGDVHWTILSPFFPPPSRRVGRFDPSVILAAEVLAVRRVETCPLVNMCGRVKRSIIFGIAFFIAVQVFWVFFSQSDLTEFAGNLGELNFLFFKEGRGWWWKMIFFLFQITWCL